MMHSVGKRGSLGVYPGPEIGETKIRMQWGRIACRTLCGSLRQIRLGHPFWGAKRFCRRFRTFTMAEDSKANAVGEKW